MLTVPLTSQSPYQQDVRKLDKEREERRRKSASLKRSPDSSSNLEALKRQTPGEEEHHQVNLDNQVEI